MTLDEERSIPEEHPVNQQIISFEGDELAAAQSENGGIYVTLPGMCTALGLATNRQVTRIQRTPVLVKGLRRMALKTPKRGTQMINCLRIDRVALWLAGMETSRLKPDIATKIESYQDELAPVAMRVFMHSMGIEPASIPVTDPRLASMLEQFDTLISVALDVQAHMNAMTVLPEQIDAMRWQLDQAMELLESIAGDNAETHQALEKIKAKTAGLTSAQARQIQEQISHMVAVTEGTPNALKHATIYGRIRHRFRVPSYSNVPDTRFEELTQFLRDELQRSTNGESPEQGNLFT